MLLRWQIGRLLIEACCYRNRVGCGSGCSALYILVGEVLLIIAIECSRHHRTSQDSEVLLLKSQDMPCPSFAAAFNVPLPLGSTEETRNMEHLHGSIPRPVAVCMDLANERIVRHRLGVVDGSAELPTG